jgi:hypothetical protein
VLAALRARDPQLAQLLSDLPDLDKLGLDDDLDLQV